MAERKGGLDAVADNPDHLPRLFVVSNNLLQDAGCGEQRKSDDLDWIHFLHLPSDRLRVS